MKKHLLISGRVQNVGFRNWLYVKATERKIYGWVKNRTNGEVEALLIGDNEKVRDVIKQCEKGPAFSNVIKIKIQNYQKEYSKKSFDILSTS